LREGRKRSEQGKQQQAHVASLIDASAILLCPASAEWPRERGFSKPANAVAAIRRKMI
jgi:hypothetical protein